MKCEDALILISAALDGEATPAETAALEEHLDNCPPCRELAADLGVLSAALRTEDPLPEGLPARVETALDGADAGARAKKPPLWRRWGGLAAVLALALCLGGVYHLIGQDGPAAVDPQVAGRSADGAEEDGAPVAAYAGDGEALTVDDPTQGGTLANAGEYVASPVEPPEGADPEPAAPEEVERALALVLEELGGMEGWPNAFPIAYNGYTAWVLSQEMGEDGETETRLEYTGWSPNEQYLVFQLREDTVTYGTATEESVSWSNLWNHYAVAVGGDEVLTEYDDDRSRAHAQVFWDTLGNPNWGDSAAAEPGHYRFTNARYIRVHYGATPAAPSAVILGSVAELAEYLAGFGSLMWDGEGNTVPIAELEELAAAYGDAFFGNGRLLAVVLEASSGGDRFELQPQGLLRDQVNVVQTQHGVTCDMAAWLIVAEVDTMFDGGDTLEVRVVDASAD